MIAAGQLALDLVALRWRDGRGGYRQQREPIDPRRFSVEPVAERAARAFVVQHHYSGTFPAAVASYGLLERTAPHRAELVGVAVFAVPMQPRAADAYGAGGIRACDLGRFVLLDHVGGNAETWFLVRALRQLGRDKTDAGGAPTYGVCLAYSDPVPRTDAAGQVRFAGHFGGIYGGAASLYLGRATPRTLWLAPDALVVSARALSQLRTGERGARYAYELLRRHGAPAIRPGEGDAAYLRRALAEGPFRRFRHRGNHAYAFPCGSHTTRRLVRAGMATGLPYPKRTDLPGAAGGGRA